MRKRLSALLLSSSVLLAGLLLLASPPKYAAAQQAEVCPVSNCEDRPGCTKCSCKRSGVWIECHWACFGASCPPPVD